MDFSYYFLMLRLPLAFCFQESIYEQWKLRILSLKKKLIFKIWNNI